MRPAARRRARAASFATVLALTATFATAAPAGAAQSPFDPPPVTGGGGPSVGLHIADRDAIATQTVAEVPIAPWQPTAPAPHVVVVSSGVDVASLPQAFAGRVTLANAIPDVVGYGTWAAATVFQAAPQARVTSINVLPNGKVQSGWVHAALKWVRDYQTAGTAPAIDAVLLAFPPHEYLDPLSLAREPGQAAFDDLMDALADRPIETADGSYVGMAMGSDTRDRQLAGVSARERGSVVAHQQLVTEWRTLRYWAGQIAGSGVPLVAPAGDLGPALQQVEGVANLPEVVTVGAAVPAGTGYAVAGTSASGPAQDGTVKPDVVAPVATVAMVPAASRLAASLDDELAPSGSVWSAEIEQTWASASSVPRARLASSLSSAALVATGLAGLHAEGVTDVATMRGALAAAAEPVAGVPVWRQGAGVLTHMPDRAYADSRGLVTGAANLGLSPESGAWSATVPVRNGTAGTPVVSLTDRAGAGARGESVLSAVGAVDAPAVSGTGGSSVTVTAVPGAEDPGLYCGYAALTLPAGTGQVTDDVPTCAVRGMTFYAESRYIHNAPAKDVTYELLPGVPPAVEGVVHRPFEMLPLDPTHLPLYVEKVTPGGCAGRFPGGYPTGLDRDVAAAGHVETCAVFGSVPPGYYQTRLFSDYGAPVTQTTAAGTTTGDLGSKTAYQKLPMWVLPAALDRPRQPDGKGTDETVGGVTYRWDKTTNTWVVGDDLDAAGLRFAYGHVKRIIGTNVTSRVVDMLDYDSFAEVDGFQAKTVAETTGITQLAAAPGETSAWRWRRSVTDPTGFAATFDPLHAFGAVVPVGWAQYPLELTTPNYLMHASVNFRYQLTDAALLVVLQVGDEYALWEVLPQGQQPVDVPPGVPVGDLSANTPWGTATGEASLDFRMKPKGVDRALLTFVALPTTVERDGRKAHTGAAVALSGASVQYDTWTPALWPQKVVCPPPPPGEELAPGCDADTPEKLHVLPVDSNYSSRQIEDDCRIVSGTNVCEDWTVLVHAPRSDAKLQDVRAGTVNVAGELLASGALRYRPEPRSKPGFSISPLMEVFGQPPGSAAFRDAFPLDGVTNNEFWDDVSIPMSFLRSRPGALTFRFADNVATDDSIAPLGAGGAAPVAPYVCYVPKSRTVGGALL